MKGPPCVECLAAMHELSIRMGIIAHPFRLPCQGRGTGALEKKFTVKRSLHRKTSPRVRAGVVPSTNRKGHRTFNAAMPGSSPAGITNHACVVELVYTADLRSVAERIGGSSPSAGTIYVLSSVGRAAVF